MKTTLITRSLIALSFVLASSLAAAATHLVRKGETITGIAHEHGCSVAALRSANQLQGDLIRAGQQLTLPPKAKTAAPASEKKNPKADNQPVEKKPAKKPEAEAAAKTKAKPATGELQPAGPGNKVKLPDPKPRPQSPEKKKSTPAKQSPVAADRSNPGQAAGDRPTRPKVKPAAKPKAPPVAQPSPNPDKVEPPALPESTPAGPLGAMLDALNEDDRWRVQIFLDQNGFPPGKVDGLTGEFTMKAARGWMSSGEGRTPETLRVESLTAVKDTALRVTIPEVAAEYVGDVPSSHEAQAKAQRLPYASLAEFMAERFHTDESTLHRLNSGRDMAALRIGQLLTVPAVVPFRIEDRKSALTPPPGGAPGTLIRILHAEHIMEVVRADGSLAASFPITVGRKPEHIRTGTWKIMSRTLDPTFLYDKDMLARGVSGKVQHLLPAGPNNPVGILWMELEPLKGPEAHIGIHGTDSSARIGRNQSSGCIRLANWDIVRLARLTKTGTLVVWDASAGGTRGHEPPPVKAADLAVTTDP